jgi:hypothetical protein
VESSCEFGIEPTGSIKFWKTIEWPNNSGGGGGLSCSAQLHRVSCIFMQHHEPGQYLSSSFHISRGIQHHSYHRILRLFMKYWLKCSFSQRLCMDVFVTQI